MKENGNIDKVQSSAFTDSSSSSLVSSIDEGTLETILLVDDNPINLQILYKTLERTGHRLHVAKDGGTALAIAEEVQPSLILLDIMMPGLDGYQVCERLKSNPNTENIAVIFLSALEDSSSKVKGFSVGGVDYISKPFQADEVVARVRNHIKVQRLESELARRNSELESENQQILNAVSEGIIGLDKSGRVMSLNPAATFITGWQAADCLGDKLIALGLFNLQDEREAKEHETLPYRSYGQGLTVRSDMEFIRCRDGRQCPVSISCTPRAEGGAVMVLRDISEWVDSEEALRVAREEVEQERQNMAHMERLSTTGEMAAGIAHEVNQPLTAIVNYARVARRLLDAETVDKQKLAELLEKLDIQSVRASDVVQRMRSFVNKPEQGRISCNPNALMQDVMALAEVDSRVSDVPLHFTPDNTLANVYADPVQIQQVALNLIRNAIESTATQQSQSQGLNESKQGVFVSTQSDGNEVKISVMDRGIGVADSVTKKLFDPFFSTKKNGMGIGLSICQTIIQAHGGEINFVNNPEGGATFYFSLPVS